MNIADAPWRKPGYKGKLKPTPVLPCQEGFIPPSDENKKEIIYTALADGDIDIDLFNKLIMKCK